MKSADVVRAQPPETLEGWYAQHQVFTIDRSSPALRASPSDAPAGVDPTRANDTGGWTAWVRLIGSKSDLMSITFRPTLDDVGIAERGLRSSPLMDALRLDYSFLSVTEAGLYNLSAELARETAERGGKLGDDIHAAELERRLSKERDNSHVQRRLYPALPDGMPYVCFYPMSKRRDPEQNWYALSLDDRSRLMQAHGKTGRRYAGRVVQIITGAIGFERWEWGVTLFAADPLDFKRLVTDMRFDEVSANYAEFGDFFVGKLIPAPDLATLGETA
jgi:chlorite dismutase